MASTGTASFTIDRNGMITSALRAIHILQDGQTATSTEISDASEILNMLIKNWQAEGLWLWTYQLVAIPMVTNKYLYTIGPVNADVLIPRPLRLFDGSYIRDTVCNPNVDTPLRLISRLEYLQLGSKLSLGVPNSIYWDAKIDTQSEITSPSLGHGTLYVYSNPMDDTRVIYANFQRQLYDMTNATDEFDFPSENFMALKWGLAAELADEYELPQDRIMRIEGKAKYYRERMADWSVEWAPMQFTPDWVTARRARF